ncbi:unnamed protein product [Ilex paraguariensis]|uniref:CONSTANS-like protein n=1 Tax=Ilex paraguariensis TaxID=185542 RepID=A0ABC8RTL2_9AQUA
MCEVCEQSPAAVTCKADAAALCVACDCDIHSANPLARRHERFPVVPFYDSAAVEKHYHHDHGGDDDVDTSEKYFSDDLEGGAEEAEAASWLLQNPNPNKIVDLFGDMDSYLDMEIISGDQKQRTQKQYSSGADGVVPVSDNGLHHQPPPQGLVVDGFPAYEVDYSGSKPFMYNFNSQSISQSLSSSALEVGVVPDHNSMADVSNSFAAKNTADTVPTNPIPGIDREARVLRYREKRKNRKFEKTIRYASRKAYAETRPRIKGRFAKRTEIEVESLITGEASYGVVPTY